MNKTAIENFGFIVLVGFGLYAVGFGVTVLLLSMCIVSGTVLDLVLWPITWLIAGVEAFVLGILFFKP